MSLKVNIAGIRGRYSDLNPNMVSQSAKAFSTYIEKGKILIGYDNRPSSNFIIPAIISGLLSGGSDVINCGIIPTPILQFLIKEYGFAGGISVSAGHNMFDWNSIVFLNGEGAYLNYIEGEELFNIYHSGKFNERDFKSLGTYKEDKNIIKTYFNKLKTDTLKRLKFVIDCSNGFNENIITLLSDSLNIDFVPIFCGKTSSLNKNPEPNIKNAEILSTVVKESDSNGGFLLNSDGSRILIVDENGMAFSEELTLPVFSNIILSEVKSDIITNYSTSKIIDSVAKKHGVKVYRTDIGQSSVMQSLKDFKAVIAGEGNGSVAYSPFSMGFDAFIFIKYFTKYLIESNSKVSAINEEFSNPNIIKKTFYAKPFDIFNRLETIGEQYPDKEIIKDGFYIEDSNRWICIRSSATLSMIRVIGEGKGVKDEIEKISNSLK